MPRDFRPKGQGGAASQRAGSLKKGKASHAIDEDDVSEDVLRREVQAMGGTDDDIALIQGKGPEPTRPMTVRARHSPQDSELSNELRAFMVKENMSLPAASAPQSDRAAPPRAKSEAKAKAKAKSEPKPKEPMALKQDRQAREKKPAPRASAAETRAADKPQRPSVSAAPVPASQHVVFDGDEPKPVIRTGLRLLIEPTSDWTHLPLPAIDAKPLSHVPETLIASLQELGKEVLAAENDTYARMASGEAGKNVILGSLNFSDLQFARTLLSSSKASTLSDRISAVTLLLQSSPIHNLKALETLMAMAGKPGREEASRATRALADWLASGGGLGSDKLHYFRDQPLLSQVAAAYQAGVTDAIRQHVCAWAFEDLLKRTYFTFVQILERQSHDTLLFMRRQAVTQVFVLLRDKAEQEHNLLRLLTNKLGDPDRSVASKASTHLMELLQVHPAMKAIVLREISETVLQSQVTSHRSRAGEAPGKGNQHATYYGVLTMNQTLFTAHDAPLANDIFSVYFQLFEVCLKQDEETADQPEDNESAPKDKKRWRDRNKGAAPSAQNKSASDVPGRLLAALLTGIRRVFPFTTLDTDAYVYFANLAV